MEPEGDGRPQEKRAKLGYVNSTYVRESMYICIHRDPQNIIWRIIQHPDGTLMAINMHNNNEVHQVAMCNTLCISSSPLNY